MSRITGAAVKSAAFGHAAKQLSVAGVRNNGSATFAGKMAFASWNENRDGSVYGWRINYPALADNALLNRREADLIAGYTLHEIGHILFTKSDVTKGQSQMSHALWNGIEDPRIEHALIVSGKARNARVVLRRLMASITATLDSGGFNPCDIGWAPVALALVCRAAYGDGPAYAKKLLDRIPEPKRSIYAWAAGQMNKLPMDRSGSYEVLNMAIEFLDRWGIVEPNNPYNPNNNPNNPEQGEEGGEGMDGVGDQASDDAGEESAFDSGDGEFDGDSDGGLGDSDGDSDGDPVKDAIKKAMRDAEVEAEDQAEVGSGGDDGSVWGDAGDDDHELSDDQFEDVSSESKIQDPEPNIDRVFESSNNRTKDPINLAPAPVGSETWMGSWDLTSLSDMTDLRERNAVKRMDKMTNSPALSAQLYRILKAVEMRGWDSGARSGRFDHRRGVKAAAGGENVFKSRWESEGVSTAVSILIDFSGSMAGSEIKEAIDSSWVLAKACERAGAEVEVAGFNNVHSGWVYQGTKLDGSTPKDDPINGYDRPRLVFLKRWQDRLDKTAPLFEVAKRMADGSTPDYAAVRHQITRLGSMPHNRKVLIVLTDGCGDMHNMKELTSVSHKLFGIDVVALGIGYSAIKALPMAYEIGVPVNGQMEAIAVKAIADQLKKRDTRRTM